MRVKTLERYIDRLFWAIIGLLPVFAYLISLIHFNDGSFVGFLNQFGILDSNIVYTGLSEIFGSLGDLPYLDTTNLNPLVLYMSYLVIIELVHIFVDVILFVPRICVKFLDKASESDGARKW